jgi:drug/metabolite transporter (DMT)-like permease
LTAQRRAEVLLLSTTVIWGSTFVVTKGLLDVTTPLAYTSIRYFLGALLTSLIFARRIAALRTPVLLPGFILGLLLFTGFAFQTVGLLFTTASKSAFFTGMLVVFTPIFHAAAQRWLAIRRKRLLAGNLVGVVLSAAGLFLLTLPGGGGFNAGDAMTLLSAALFALYIVYLDSLQDSVDPMALTFIIFLVCGILGAVSALLWEDVRIVPGPDFFIPLAYLVVFATVIASGIQNAFQAETSPTRAAVIFSLEPVIAAIFAYSFGGERLGPSGIAGAGIIFVGLLLSELSENIPLMNRAVGRGGGSTPEIG